MHLLASPCDDVRGAAIEATASRLRLHPSWTHNPLYTGEAVVTEVLVVGGETAATFLRGMETALRIVAEYEMKGALLGIQRMFGLSTVVVESNGVLFSEYRNHVMQSLLVGNWCRYIRAWTHAKEALCTEGRVGAFCAMRLFLARLERTWATVCGLCDDTTGPESRMVNPSERVGALVAALLTLGPSLDESTQGPWAHLLVAIGDVCRRRRRSLQSGLELLIRKMGSSVRGLEAVLFEGTAAILRERFTVDAMENPRLPAEHESGLVAVNPSGLIWDRAWSSPHRGFVHGNARSNHNISVGAPSPQVSPSQSALVQRLLEQGRKSEADGMPAALPQASISLGRMRRIWAGEEAISVFAESGAAQARPIALLGNGRNQNRTRTTTLAGATGMRRTNISRERESGILDMLERAVTYERSVFVRPDEHGQRVFANSTCVERQDGQPFPGDEGVRLGRASGGAERGGDSRRQTHGAGATGTGPVRRRGRKRPAPTAYKRTLGRDLAPRTLESFVTAVLTSHAGMTAETLPHAPCPAVCEDVETYVKYWEGLMHKEIRACLHEALEKEAAASAARPLQRTAFTVISASGPEQGPLSACLRLHEGGTLRDRMNELRVGGNTEFTCAGLAVWDIVRVQEEGTAIDTGSNVGRRKDTAGPSRQLATILF